MMKTEFVAGLLRIVRFIESPHGFEIEIDYSERVRPEITLKI